MKKLIVVIAAMAMLGAAVPAFAEDGVSAGNGGAVITNVWFQPFGLVNLTIPWKDAQVAGLVDVLHDDPRTIAAVEGPFIKQLLWGRVIQGNIGLASVLVGDRKCGLIETSLNFTGNDPNLTDNWSGGVWIGSAFDGSGPWGGYKVFTRF